MDVRVEATKAALCFSSEPRVTLLAGTHRSLLCLWTVDGTQCSVTPPQCHMNSSRCVECASGGGRSAFYSKKNTNRAIVLSLRVITSVSFHREQGPQFVFMSAAKNWECRSDITSCTLTWETKKTPKKIYTERLDKYITGERAVAASTQNSYSV